MDRAGHHRDDADQEHEADDHVHGAAEPDHDFRGIGLAEVRHVRAEADVQSAEADGDHGHGQGVNADGVERHPEQNITDQNQRFSADDGAGGGEDELATEDLLALDGEQSENPELATFEANHRENEPAERRTHQHRRSRDVHEANHELVRRQQIVLVKLPQVGRAD